MYHSVSNKSSGLPRAHRLSERQVLSSVKKAIQKAFNTKEVRLETFSVGDVLHGRAYIGASPTFEDMDPLRRSSALLTALRDTIGPFWYDRVGVITLYPSQDGDSTGAAQPKNPVDGPQD